MTKKEAREYCLSLPGASSDFPFDQVTEVFRLRGKMFALMSSTNQPGRINLKCDPPLARDLRDRYPAVVPGYHMNKEHWNTVILDGSLPDEMVRGMIDHSYDLILDSLPKKQQQEIRGE
jgi:predicted DNA-binding protein (MmcQ/YjbR family)